MKKKISESEQKKRTLKRRKNFKVVQYSGRPPKFKSKKELQDKINAYFVGGCKTRSVVINKKTIEIPNPTITGLCLFLGFCDRQSFYDYENLPEYAGIIKRARLMIEEEYEQLLKGNNVTGAIFALKNMRWEDKSSVDNNINIEKPIEIKYILPENTEN